MRKGYGLGKGQGYKNLLPMDSYVHSLNAYGIRTASRGLFKAMSKARDEINSWIPETDILVLNAKVRERKTGRIRVVRDFDELFKFLGTGRYEIFAMSSKEIETRIEEMIKEEGFEGTPDKDDMARLKKIIDAGKSKGWDSNELSRQAIDGESLTKEQEKFIDAEVDYDFGTFTRNKIKEQLEQGIEVEFVETIVVDKVTHFGGGIPLYNLSGFTNFGREADETFLTPIKKQKDLEAWLEKKGFELVNEFDSPQTGTTLQKWKLKKTSK